MIRPVLRLVLYLGILSLTVWGVGRYGYDRSQNDFYGSVYTKDVPALQGVKRPEHDPKRPTVAIVMGNATTEDFDFLMPYELFARAGAFNVYAVAPDTHVKSLTGGLDVVPHYSFSELDAVLGKSPDILMVPNMMERGSKGYEPVRAWLRQHADTTLLSVCGGSINLADAGLLKGKSAATHWQITVAEEQFPDTRWVWDQRYVIDGNVITAAGQTAGIDAILRLISERVGEPVAQRVAAEIHYPSYQFVHNPTVDDPFKRDLRFWTYNLNNAFQWQKQTAGVLLYNGMDELALSSIFDTYSDTGTTRVLTITGAEPEQVIVTAHNLNLFARYQIANAPKLDRMIVPGAHANSLAAAEFKQWNETGHAEALLFMHSVAPDRYVFEAPLEDLAKQEDLLTGGHAVKRLEYRANNLKLEGRPFSIETYGNLLVTAVAALLVALVVDRSLIMKKRAGERSGGE